MQLLQALLRTFTETADSKKAFYSFLATALLAVLILHFKVDPVIAGVIVGPLVVLTGTQAHVDAKAAAAKGTGSIKEMAVGQLIDSRELAPGEKLADAFDSKTRPGD